MSDHTHQGGESFRLDLLALADDVPVAVRLRGVLKRLLRDHRFKVLRIEDTTPTILPPERTRMPQDSTRPVEATGGSNDDKQL